MVFGDEIKEWKPKRKKGLLNGFQSLVFYFGLFISLDSFTRELIIS